MPISRINTSMNDHEIKGLSGGYSERVVASHSTSSSRPSTEILDLIDYRPEFTSYDCLPNPSLFTPMSQMMFSNQCLQPSERLMVRSGIPSSTALSHSNNSHVTIHQNAMISLNQELLSQPQNFIQSQKLVHHVSKSSQIESRKGDQYNNMQFKTGCSSEIRNFPNCPINSQFDNSVPPFSQSSSQNISSSNFFSGPDTDANVSALPCRHKILINPHFKGNQVKSEGKPFET